MKIFSRFLVAGALSLLLVQAPAFAATSYDVALSFDFSKTPSTIKNGDAVNVIFTIENVGQNAMAPRSVIYILLPPQLNYQSVSSSYPNFDCPINELMATNDLSLDFNSKYDSHHIIGCYDSGDGFFSSLNPGSKINITLSTTAVSTFVAGSTSLVAFNLSNDPETESSTFTSAIQSASTSGGDPTSISSNNVASYLYSAPSTTATTAAVTTTAAQTSVLDKTQTSQADTTNGTASGEALPTLSETKASVTDKAKIAIGKKLNLPERLNQPDNNRSQAIFNGKYKTQFISISILLLGAILISLYFRRRYIRTASAQKEYRDALKIMQNNKLS